MVMFQIDGLNHTCGSTLYIISKDDMNFFSVEQLQRSCQHRGAVRILFTIARCVHIL